MNKKTENIVEIIYRECIAVIRFCITAIFYASYYVLFKMTTKFFPLTIALGDKLCMVGKFPRRYQPYGRFSKSRTT